MESILATDRYMVRVGRSRDAIAQLQALRGRAFQLGRLDQDTFDQTYGHVGVWGLDTDAPLAAFRYRVLRDADDFKNSYTGQFYDLSPFLRADLKCLDFGRFCVALDCDRPADVLRLMWAALYVISERDRVDALIGCSSFTGTRPADYDAVWHKLWSQHLGPDGLRPEALVEHSHQLKSLAERSDDQKGEMPPLLRGYLALGGWTGEDMVTDRYLNTMHVFTAVKVADIPPARRRALAGIVANATPDRRMGEP